MEIVGVTPKSMLVIIFLHDFKLYWRFMMDGNCRQHPAQEEDFMEINDLQNNDEVQYLLQHENEVFQLNPQEHELMEEADDFHQQLDINIPAAPGS